MKLCPVFCFVLFVLCPRLHCLLVFECFASVEKFEKFDQQFRQKSTKVQFLSRERILVSERRIEVVNEKSYLAVRISSIWFMYLSPLFLPSSLSLLDLLDFFLLFSSCLEILLKTYPESKATHSQILSSLLPLCCCERESSNRFIFSPMMIWNHKNPFSLLGYLNLSLRNKQTNKLSFH